VILSSAHEMGPSASRVEEAHSEAGSRTGRSVMFGVTIGGVRNDDMVVG